MVSNDPTKPEDEKTTPETETPNADTPTDEITTPEGEQLDLNNESPPPDKTAEEAAALNQADKTAPGDNVVNYDFNTKNRVAQENPAQPANLPEEKPREEQAPEAPKRRGRPPNPNKAAQAENPNKDSKPTPKTKPDKPAKEKSGAGGSKKAAGEKQPKSAKAEKEPEPPAPPPEPTTAPRAGEQEQIVYINLSELHPFKDHPFQVKQDAEMAAMVETTAQHNKPIPHQ